jgi:hypothetical protein
MFLAGKLLTWGAECWKESVKLLTIAEAAAGQNSDSFIVRRRFLSHCIQLFFFFHRFLVTLLRTFIFWIIYFIYCILMLAN